MANYKYAVRLRGKVVAYTTTKREAEQEARAVGGTYGPIESVPAAPKANPAFAEVYGKGAYAEVPKKVLQQDSDLADEAFDLIDRAYAPIGGHAGMRDVPSMLADDADMYVMEDIDEDPQADVLQVYKTTDFGRKAVAVGQDGTKEARRRAVSLKIEDLDRPGYYGEVSGRIAEILLGAGVPVVTDPEVVRMVLRKPIEWLNNGGWYRRMLGGHMHEKILVGRPLIPNPRDASTRFRTLDQTGLGLILRRDPDRAMLLLIDPNADPLPRDYDDEDEDLYERAVVGMLELDKHDGQCWGAWEVMASAVDERYAGQGLGMAMYLAALALLDAPIVSDRHSVSPAARRVWNRIFEDTADFWREPLDNILMPKTPPRVDDCRVHNDPALDRAYRLSPRVRDAILSTVRKLSRRGLAIAEEHAQAGSGRFKDTTDEVIEGRWSNQATELFEEALNNRSSPKADLEVSEEDLSELRRLLRL
jgi:GNAT superfamily N-acetyltransferase